MIPLDLGPMPAFSIHSAIEEVAPTGVVPAPKVPGPADLPAGLECVRWHESRDDYRAVNEDSGAAGAFQMMPAYSDDWARRYGHPEWASRPANQWPRAVQDDVALGLWEKDRWIWRDFTSYSCPGF